MRFIKSDELPRLDRTLRTAVALCVSVTLVACGGSDLPTDAATKKMMLAAESAVVTKSVDVIGLTKVSETRISRTEFEYIFHITVKNNGPESMSGVSATLTAAGPGTTIIDGSVLVGDIAAGATVTPTDTIRIRQDRTIAFNQAALIWSLTGAGSTPQIGYRLEGAPGSSAANAFSDYEETAESIEPVDTSRGLPIIRTVLGISVKQTATVADVNAILDSVGGTIVASANTKRFFYIRFPDPGSISALQGIIASIESQPQVSFVLESVEPDPAEIPGNNPLMQIVIEHLSAIGAPAAWNARSAIGSDRPSFVITDLFGNGVPNGVTAGVVNPARLGTIKHSHGYHVLGIALGSFSTDGSAIGDVTGAYPGDNPKNTLATYLVDLQAGGTPPPASLPGVSLAKATLYLRTYHWLNQAVRTYGKAVLNTSLGHNWYRRHNNSPFLRKIDIPIYESIMQKEALAWAQLVRGDENAESSLEGKYFHAQAAGNDYFLAAYPDLKPMTHPRNSLGFARVAVLPKSELGFPPFRNVAVVESRDVNFTGGLYSAGALSTYSNRDGTISAVGCIDSSSNPWSEIYSFGSPYSIARMCGTSMATPAVAGIAAYLWSVRPDLSAFDINARLTNNGTAGSGSVAPVLDAYAAILTADQTETRLGAPARFAILDVAGGLDGKGDGIFNEADLLAFKNAFTASNAGTTPDYGRYDLNGDGYTGGAGTRRFNLNMDLNSNQASIYETLTRKLGATTITFNEKALTDVQILCYYAYGSLYDSRAASPGSIIGPLCGSAPSATLIVNDSVLGWFGFPATIELTDLIQRTIPQFQAFGSNCEERGGPIFSSFVDPTATLYAALTTTGVPSQLSGPFINRRNCSSFVAIKPVVNPVNPSEVKPRVWINGTGRAVSFSIGRPDWEYQVRFDSGDPFTGLNKRCEIGTVPNSGNFAIAGTSSQCEHILNF